MQSVSSNGGPLIALPAECARSWCGTDPSPGTSVPEGWEWSGDDDDPVRTDYDRACGELRALHMSAIGGIGLIQVRESNALVLTGSTATRFLALEDGGAFLRNVPFADENAARTAIERAPKWETTRAELELTDGRLFVFDSAYPYPGPVAVKALGGVLTAELTPGRYRVLACDYVPEAPGDYELIAYRLVRMTGA